MVVIEESDTGFGAYMPDLPGCIAAADSRAEVTRLIHEAIELHLEVLAEEGTPFPAAHSTFEVVEVPGR